MDGSQKTASRRHCLPVASHARSIATDRSEPDDEAPRHALACEIIETLATLRTSEAVLLKTQAMLLAHLSEKSRLSDLGFPSIAGFAEEILLMPRRTVYDRLTLHRILSGCPAAERAFLEGRLTQCQLLALAPLLDTENAAEWIEKGSRLSVREIRRLVREAREDRLDKARRDPGVEVSFEAPAEFQIVWRETLELARRVLGYQAPQYACLEAIFQETGVAGGGEPIPPAEASRGSIPAVSSPLPPITLRPDPKAEADAREHLSLLRRYREEIGDLLESDLPTGAEACRDRLIQIARLLAPLRVLTGRILRDLGKTGLFLLYGYRDLDSFVTEICGISARTARNRIDAAFALEDEPLLEEAYGRGEIGIVAAHLLHRLRPGRDLGSLVERAKQITARQLIREYRLLCNLESCEVGIARLGRRPFPQAGLEGALIEALCKEGEWTREKLASTMAARSLRPASAGESSDPAENPGLIDRLEFLVDLLLLLRWEDPPDPADKLPASVWKTSAHFAMQKRITFWLPREIAADLRAAVEEACRRRGRFLPIWVVLTLLFAEARDVWLQHDPKKRPRWQRILKRDGYRCQFPSCGRRRNLEVHHIEPCSQGGIDHPDNLITLCAFCHRRLIHAGAARVCGKAPHALSWVLGGRGGRGTTLRLRGNRIVSRIGVRVR